MTSIQPVLERQGKHNYLPVVVGILLLFVAVGIGYLVVTSATTTKVDLRNPLAVNPELNRWLCMRTLCLQVARPKIQNCLASSVT